MFSRDKVQPEQSITSQDKLQSEQILFFKIKDNVNDFSQDKILEQ